MSATVLSTQPAVDLLQGERRRAPRHSCRCPCFVRPDAAAGFADWPGLVYDISTGGIGLVLDCPLRLGTVLIVQPHRRKRVSLVRARIVRATFVECAWFYGCQFLEPLPDQDLLDWLA